MKLFLSPGLKFYTNADVLITPIVNTMVTHLCLVICEGMYCTSGGYLNRYQKLNSNYYQFGYVLS